MIVGDQADQADAAGNHGDTRLAENGASPSSVPVFDLAANVNYLLRRSHARADALFSRRMSDIGVTPRQAALLFAVGAAPGCSLAELARITGIDRGTIAEMVPRLVKRGMLRREQASDDGRAKSLTCTAAGTLAFNQVNERTPELRRDVLSTLPPEYHELLVKMLGLLVRVEVEVRTKTYGRAANRNNSTSSGG